MHSPFLGFLVLACALSSCAAYTTDRPQKLNDTPLDWRRLPYHVAVIPVDRGKVNALPDGGDRKGAPFAFQFDDLAAKSSDEAGQFSLLTERLQGVLELNAFRKVTVLPRPTLDEYEALTATGLLANYWVAAAREAEADLLLDVDSFSYPVKPRSRAEILSFALFLAGPVELLFPDREYSFEGVTLQASLYDIDGLGAPRYRDRSELLTMIESAREGTSESVTDLLANAARFSFDPVQGGGIQGTLRQFIVSPPDMKFRFGDRLGGGPAKPSFWTSIFIPSAWLQRDSEAFSVRLTDDTAIALAQDLAREIVEGDWAYIVGPTQSTTGLLFDAKTAELTESATMEGVLELRARMRHPSAAIKSPQVRVMGHTYGVSFNGEALRQVKDLRTAILDNAYDGVALARLDPIEDPKSKFDSEMTLYLPSPEVMGPVPSGADWDADVFPELVPLDSVQLSLGEDLGSRGFREKSWTFDLGSIYSKAVLDGLVEDAVQDAPGTFNESSYPIVAE